MTTTVAALFDHIDDAHAAIRELHGLGIANADISLIVNDTGGHHRRELERTAEAAPVDDDNGAAAAGAGIGAALGGLSGLLVGLGALTIPGIGPIIAAGPLAIALSTLVGAGAGAAAGGAAGVLVEAGIPREEADYYSEGLRRGGVLVMARVDETVVDQATNIMHLHGAVNARERADAWRREGWAGQQPAAGRVEITNPRDHQSYRQDRFPEAEPGFREHFQATYGLGQHDYEQTYRPAYEFGWQLGRQERYRGLDWPRLEPEARLGWDERYPGSSFDDVSAAVRHAWQAAAEQHSLSA
jgi:hypothetical protein